MVEEACNDVEKGNAQGVLDVDIDEFPEAAQSHRIAGGE